MKIGEYVTAEIEGKKIPDAIVIPSATIYQDTYVYVVNEGVIERRDIDVIWRNKTEALIGEGLVNGDRLVTTTLGQVASGTRVNIEGEAKPQRGRGNSGAPGKPSKSEAEKTKSQAPKGRPEKPQSQEN